MMQIIVRTVGSKAIVLDVEPNTTVMSVKELICYGHTSAPGCSIPPHAVQHIAPVSQRLLFGGRQMEDDGTLSSYGVSNCSTLHLTMRMVGGVLLFEYNNRFLNFTLNACSITCVRVLKLELKKRIGFSPLIFYKQQKIESFVNKLDPYEYGNIAWKEIFGENILSITLHLRKPESVAPAVVPKPGLECLLAKLNVHEYYGAFIKHKVEIEDLPNLDEEDLKELIPEIGPRSRLRAYLRKRKRSEDSEKPYKRIKYRKESHFGCQDNHISVDSDDVSES